MVTEISLADHHRQALVVGVMDVIQIDLSMKMESAVEVLAVSQDPRVAVMEE